MVKSAYSRREFVKIMAQGGAALTIPGCGLFQSKEYAPNLGIYLLAMTERWL